jgi:protein-L-isoaspartate O-methyltransferase
MDSNKLNLLADKLQAEAEAKRRPGMDNTPKRAKEAAYRSIEARQMELASQCLRGLAGLESIPAELAGIRFSKAAAVNMCQTRIDTSGGYYSVHDTGEFRDQSDAAKAFRAIGLGKTDPEVERKARIEKMERDIRFLKIPGFFPTPPDLIMMLMELADVQPGMLCLEPSAGKGDIAEALRKAGGEVHCVEIQHCLREILLAKGLDVKDDDFTAYDPHEGERYNRIVMNPPFEKGQDIDHVLDAIQLLRQGGRLVAVMSTGPFFRSDSKSRDFQQFAADNLVIHEVEPGAFKSAFNPTGVNCKVVVFNSEAKS